MAVIKQSPGSHQAVIRQWYGSYMAVIRKSSGTHQAVFRQSLSSHQAVIMQSSVIFFIHYTAYDTERLFSLVFRSFFPSLQTRSWFFLDSFGPLHELKKSGQSQAELLFMRGKNYRLHFRPYTKSSHSYHSYMFVGLLIKIFISDVSQWPSFVTFFPVFIFTKATHMLAKPTHAQSICNHYSSLSSFT